jgi:hypothetical protein
MLSGSSRCALKPPCARLIANAGQAGSDAFRASGMPAGGSHATAFMDK